MELLTNNSKEHHILTVKRGVFTTTKKLEVIDTSKHFRSFTANETAYNNSHIQKF